MRRAVAIASLSLLLPAGARAFANLAVGEPLPNPQLPLLGGGSARLLVPGEISVFVFFRPGQDHSLQTLEQMAELERELAGRPVRFVAVTSADYDREAVRATAAEAGVRMPVLLDDGDALYGELGVSLHPCVGVAGADQRLAAYQHYLKVNMLDVVRGRIRAALGDIGPEELARVLEPPRAGSGDPLAPARQRARLAAMLLERGNLEKALESAGAAVQAGPELAEAHAVLARALAAAGRCPESAAASAQARRLAPAGGDPAPACQAR